MTKTGLPLAQQNAAGPMSEIVSLLEFARRQNVQMTTIKKYVLKGKIHGPAIEMSAGGKPKLRYDIALQQYNQNRENVAHRFARSGHTLGGASAEPEPEAAPLFEPEPAPKPGKLSPKQAAQMDNLIALGKLSVFDRNEKLHAYAAGEYDLPEGPVLEALLKEAGIKRNRVTIEKIEGPRRPQGHGGNLKTGADKIEADVSEVTDFSQAALSELQLPALTKLESVLRVRKAQVELQEKEGKLVDVGAARNALFSAAQEIKNRMEAIPDRVIDEILAAKNRNEAYLVLRAEINSALNDLADLPTTQLSNKRKLAAVTAE